MGKFLCSACLAGRIRRKSRWPAALVSALLLLLFAGTTGLASAQTTGANLYGTSVGGNDACVGCHGSAPGFAGNLPPPVIANGAALNPASTNVSGDFPAFAISVVLFGTPTDDGFQDIFQMAAYADAMSNAQVATLLNYIYGTVDSSLGTVTEAQVEAVRNPVTGPSFGESLAASRHEDTLGSQSAVGTVIATVSVEDFTNPTYSIQDDPEDLFGIGASTGVISLTVAHGFDHDTKASYTVSVRAVEGTVMLDDAFVLTIEPVGPPSFGDSLAASRDEDTLGSQSAVGEVIATVSVDQYANSTYSIQDDPEDLFGIGASTGVISLTVAHSFRHNTKASHTVSVRAVLSDGTTMLDDAFVLTVDPVDEDPYFTEALADHEVTYVSSSIPALTISEAADPDDTEDITTDIDYSMELADGEPLPTGMFFDPNSRILWVDFADRPATLRIKAKAVDLNDDTSFDEGEFILTVNVAGIFTERLSSATIALANTTTEYEIVLGSPPSSNVTATLTHIEDPPVLQLAPDALVFTPGTWNVPQTVTVEVYGLAFVNPFGAPYFEVAVFDPDNSDADYQSLPTGLVELLPFDFDAANAVPVIDAAHSSKQVDENIGTATYAVGAGIGAAITATDPDVKDALVYAVDPAHPQVGIDPASGQLNFKAATNLNYEVLSYNPVPGGDPKPATFSVTVVVHDGWVEDVRASSSITVQITVANVVETPSTYSAHNLAVVGRTREDATISWSNSEFLAQFGERDRGDVEVIYKYIDLADGSEQEQTSVVSPVHPMVTVISPYLLAGTSLTVSVVWNSGEAASHAAVTSSILPNRSPTFTPPDSNPVLEETTGTAVLDAHAVVVTIDVQDPDGDFIIRTLQGEAGTDAASFWIDSAGILYGLAGEGFNHEVKPSYTLTIEVNDEFYNPPEDNFTISITITVDIGNKIEEPSMYENVDERVISAFDTKMVFTWSNDDYFEQFTAAERASIVVVHDDGSTQTAVDVSEDALDVAMPTVTISGLTASTEYDIILRWYSIDGSYGSSSHTFSQRTAAPNALPQFTASSLARMIDESQGLARIAAGTALATVVATDGDSHSLTFSALSGDDDDVLQISAGGVVSPSVAHNFSYESKSKYTLNVRVDDGFGGTADGKFVLSLRNIDEFASFTRPNLGRVAVRGHARKITLEVAQEPENTSAAVTYSLLNKPAWLSQNSTSPRELQVAATAPVGLHTITVRTANSSDEGTNSELILDVIPEPSLHFYELFSNQLNIIIAAEACRSIKRFADNSDSNGGIARLFTEISYNSGTALASGTTPADCEDTHVESQALGDGGAAVDVYYGVGSDFADTSANETYNIVTPDSELGPGVHSYAVDYVLGEKHYGSGSALMDREFYRKSFSVTYELVEAATVTIAEVAGEGAAAPAGHILGTVVLSSSVGSSAAWSLGSGSPPGVAIGAGSATKGILSLTVAATVDFEISPQYMTVAVEALTPITEDDVVQAKVSSFVVHLDDVDDPPYFASAFPDQRVSAGQESMFTVPAAQDRESDTLAHSASLINPAAALPAKGVSFNPANREFTVAANAAAGTVTVAVKAVQTDDSTMSATDEFVLVITPAGIDVGSPSGLDKTTVKEELPVKLLGQPAGGANVTLTITSADAADVAVAPDTMVFTPSNWNTAQDLTLSLTDAGVAVKGMRDVAIGLAVHEAGSSAANYQSVPAVNFNVAVDVTNASPEFAAGERLKTQAEHVGSATAAIGDAVGTPVQATDDDNTDLTYSINPASALFTIDSATGQLAHKAATNFDHESSTNSHLVTVEVHDGEDPSIRGSAKVTVVVGITDVNEPPVLPALEDQTVIAGVGGRYQFPAAMDPDTGDDASIAYTSVFVGRGCPGCMRFVDSTRTFVFPPELTTVQELTIRVVATSRGNLSDSEDFVLRVREGGSIVADVSSAAALSRTNKTEVIGVRLDLEPKSKGVTLTLESLDAADVAVGPVTMEFTTGNWNVAQELTVSLTDAGVAIKGSRVVSVSLGVYSQSGSDEYYRGSAAHTIAVQVANANAATEFNLPVIAAIDLMLDESVGSDPRAAAVDVGGSPIAASDADNTDLTYSLLEGGTEFAIASDGQLSARAGVNFNHERQPVHEVVVVATDGEAAAPGVVPGVATVTVTVQVNDVDEKPDSYTGHGLASRGETRNEITLGWSNSGYEAQFDAEDRASIVVSFGGDGYKGTVALAADATQVRLVGLVPGTSYALSLHWYSADGIAQATAAEPGAAVMTGANMVPVLGGLTYSRDEDAGIMTTAAGTAVATVSATDGDGDEVMYSIQGGADAARFVIDAQGGVVRLAETVNFDHEVKSSYTLTVAATDIYGASDSGELVLGIEDVVEDPVLPVQYAHTAKQGSAATITLRAATNPQDMSASIEYSAELEGGGALPGWLSVNEMNGQLTVDSSAQAGTWRVMVRAMVSSGGSTSTGLPAAFTEPTIASERLFVLSVTPAANNVPSFGSATRSFNLDENSEFAAGHSVGTVAATDADADTLAYSLRGEDAAPFAIGAGGVLTLKEERTFDAEGKESWKFVVDVDDGNGGLASTEVEVMIDGVDEPPEFLSAQPAYRVVGRTESDFVVQPAVDPESDSISYAFSSPGAWLTLDDSDPLALVFTVAAGAPVGVHPVTLTATAGSETAEHEFDIEVQTAGNRAPQFASAAAQLAIETQTAVAAATPIGSFAASDADAHELSYSIVSGGDAALFAIDAASGRVEVAAGQQLAVGATYRFTVEVSDGNGGISRMEVAVQVAVRVQETFVDAGARQQDEVAAVVMDRSLALAAIDMLQARINASPASSGGLALSAGDEPPYMRMASATDQWSDWRQDHESDGDRIERMQWRDFLYSRGFDLALDDSGSRGPRTRLWGSGSRSTLDGAPVEDGARTVYDGSAKLFMVGVETGMARTRLGVAVGQSDAKLSLGSAADARAERDLMVVYPYLSFHLSERVRAWAAGGYGSGEYARVETGGPEDVRTVRDATHTSVAGGIESSWGEHPAELSAGVKALVVKSRLDENASQPALDGSFWRGEADFRAARRFDLMPDLWLRPFVGVHLHHDGGDDWLDSNSLDTTAGLSLAWGGGLRLEFSSRWQTNDGDVNDERLEASIDYDYGSDGRGLMLSASPSMESGSDAPWRRSLDARLGYGLPVRLLSDRGIATVSAELSGSSESLGRSYGLSFAGRRLDVDLSAGEDSYRIGLRMR